MPENKTAPPAIPFRPSWVHCVVGFDTKTTWCGRALPAFEWAFQDVEHAARVGEVKSRLVVCRECVEAITAALQNGHDDPEYAKEKK